MYFDDFFSVLCQTMALGPRFLDLLGLILTFVFKVTIFKQILNL